MALRNFFLVGPFIGGAYKCSPNLKAYRQGEGGSIFDSLTPSTVCQQTCLAGEYILDFPIEIPIFRFSYVLSAVLAQTSSIPRKTIRIVHETY